MTENKLVYYRMYKDGFVHCACCTNDRETITKAASSIHIKVYNGIAGFMLCADGQPSCAFIGVGKPNGTCIGLWGCNMDRNNSFGQVVWSVFSTAFNSVSGILALPFNGFDIDGYFEVYHEGIRGIFFNVLGSDLLVFSKNEFVAEDRFWEMVTELANKHFDAKDEFEDYFKDAEENFYKDLATALGLNSEGSVTYTYRLEDLQNKATAMLIPIISLVY